eukprot:1149235-Pelagomonas_calceolata.AAC.1
MNGLLRAQQHGPLQPPTPSAVFSFPALQPLLLRPFSPFCRRLCCRQPCFYALPAVFLLLGPTPSTLLRPFSPFCRRLCCRQPYFKPFLLFPLLLSPTPSTLLLPFSTFCRRLYCCQPYFEPILLSSCFSALLPTPCCFFSLPSAGASAAASPTSSPLRWRPGGRANPSRDSSSNAATTSAAAPAPPNSLPQPHSQRQTNSPNSRRSRLSPPTSPSRAQRAHQGLALAAGDRAGVEVQGGVLLGGETAPSLAVHQGVREHGGSNRGAGSRSVRSSEGGGMEGVRGNATGAGDGQPPRKGGSVREEAPANPRSSRGGSMREDGSRSVRSSEGGGSSQPRTPSKASRAASFAAMSGAAGVGAFALLGRLLSPGATGVWVCA